MCGLCKITEITHHAYHPAFFIVHLVVLLTFYSAGRADIVVYRAAMDVAVAAFPYNELPYTQSVERTGIRGALVAADPLHACVNISRPPDIYGSMNWFVLMSGNFCTFETKVRNARLAGYTLGIIYTYRGRVENFSNLGHYRFYSDMPTVVVKTEHGLQMKENYLYESFYRYQLVVFPNISFSMVTFLLLFAIVAGIFLVIILAFTVIRFFQQSNTVHNGRLSSQHLRHLQTATYQKGDLYETCAICLEDYKDQDKLRILPCSHGYHMKCIDPWLTNNRRICPVCKRKVLMGGETSSSHANQNIEETESTPLLQGSRVGPRSGFSYSTASSVISVPTHEHLASSLHSTSDTILQPERQDRQHDVDSQ